MNSPDVIALSNVSFRYGTEHDWVFESLSASIHHGSVTALLGPNGVGKTTLLYLMLGVLHPQAGEIRLNGRDIDGYTRQEISRIVGCSREMAGRVLKNLEAEGLISSSGMTIVVHESAVEAHG